MREAAPDVPRGGQDYWRGFVRKSKMKEQEAIGKKKEKFKTHAGKRRDYSLMFSFTFFLLIMFLPLTIHGSKHT